MADARITNEKTGGEKGTKLERFDLIPVGPLTQLARMYGLGAQKYAPRNWERGYDWSLSYAALQRHATAFWGGEDAIQQNELGDDPTAGVNHLVAVAWHALAMLEWMTTHPELDDRPSVTTPPYMVLGERCDARTARRKLRERGLDPAAFGISPEGEASHA